MRNLANQIGNERGEKFPLVGETMFGDYNQWMGEDLCDSVTNYEAYKGLWSSMNAANMHEIAYALERQSGSQRGTSTPAATCSTSWTIMTCRASPPSWTTRTSWSRSTACSLR